MSSKIIDINRICSLLTGNFRRGIDGRLEEEIPKGRHLTVPLTHNREKSEMKSRRTAKRCKETSVTRLIKV